MTPVGKTCADWIVEELEVTVMVGGVARADGLRAHLGAFSSAKVSAPPKEHVSEGARRSLAFLRSTGVNVDVASGRARVSAARSAALSVDAAAAKAAKTAAEDSDDRCSTDLENEFDGSASDDPDTGIQDLKEGKSVDIRRLNLVPRMATRKKQKCDAPDAVPAVVQDDGGAGRGAKGANHLFDWGPASFSIIRTKGSFVGVGCSWKSGEFLQNSFNPSRDGTVMTSGKSGIGMEQCVQCIKHWLAEANFHWTQGDEVAMKKVFASAAPFYGSSPEPSRRLSMVASGYWTQAQADELA